MTLNLNNITVVIENDYAALSQRAASLLVAEINRVIGLRDKANLVLSAGSTPEGTYQLLRTTYRHQVDWSKVALFQMDEYLGLPNDHEQSYAWFLQTKLVNPLGIGACHFLIKDGREDLEEFEKKLQQQGGIDIVLHGIGRNGHLGFNEPGSAFDSISRVVWLSESTIQANSRFFSSPDQVPQLGVTLGFNLLSKAKTTILLAAGSEKMQAIHDCLTGPVSEAVPASILQTCPHVTCIVDIKAGSQIKSRSLEVL